MGISTARQDGSLACFRWLATVEAAVRIDGTGLAYQGWGCLNLPDGVALSAEAG